MNPDPGSDKLISMTPHGPATTHPGESLLVEAAVPGTGVSIVGVLLLDPEANRLRLRFRRDWDELFADPEDVEYFAALEQDLEARAGEAGPATMLRQLEDSLSNSVLVTDRERVLVEDWDKALARLYRKHVPAKVLPFRTHLRHVQCARRRGRLRRADGGRG